MDEQLLSMDEAARRVGLSRRTLDMHSSTGALPTIKIGRRRLVRAEALKAFIDERAVSS